MDCFAKKIVPAIPNAAVTIVLATLNVSTVLVKKKRFIIAAAAAKLQ